MTLHLRQLLAVSRPISWLNTAFPFAATYIVLTQSISPVLIIGTLFFLFPYNLLMYGVNDVFDYESDIRNPRKGGIEGAMLDRSLHRKILWAATLLALPFVGALIYLGNLAATITLLAVAFMVVAYSVASLRFKERPVLDSITSSTHFVGPMVFAMMLVGWRPEYLPYVLAFFAWGMASHAFGAVQDIAADKAARISSIATVIGPRATVWVAAILYAAACITMFTQGLAGLIVGAAGHMYIANIVPFLGVNEENAHTANIAWRRFIWLNLICGFIITMVLILRP